MPQAETYKRKQYFVAKKFQLKYIGLILFLAFLTAIMCAYVIYYTMMITMGEKIANVYPQGRLIAIVNAVNFRILLSMLLLSPLIVLIGILASHKIAGPIFRIERFLQDVADGNLSEIITVRRNDELISLVNGINGVVDSMKTTISNEKIKLSNISITMEVLRKVADTKPVDNAVLDHALDRLNEEVTSLAKELDKYKLRSLVD